MTRQILFAAVAGSALALAACQQTAPEGVDHDETAGVDDSLSTGERRGERDVAERTDAPEAEPATEVAMAPPPAPPPAPSAAMDGSGYGVAGRSRAMLGAAAGDAAANVLPPIAAQPEPGDIDRERFPDEEYNPVQLVSEEPVSTFSVDVDTASYAVVRRYLSDGIMPPSDAVRIEEMVNYFDYDYPYPDDRQQPFSVSTTLAPSPWNENAQLLHIGLQGFDIIPEERPRANLVFLLDVSGSMNQADKLPLLQQSMRMLVDQLNDDDSVSIVVYAGAAGAVLEPTPGSERARIRAAIDNLSAGGSTAGGEGLRLAYNLAEQNFDEDAVNRIILATDGDFNVGVTSDESLEDFITRQRDSGIYLSILGFGRGNYNDRLMQTLAQAGNGTAAYIDSLNEARKVLADEMQGSLFPIANDVKIQIEFNPALVAEYRLIGYETRMLRREDFSNDAVDAGEIGAGHEVTAIYEIVAPDSPGRLIEPGRYEEVAETPEAFSDEIAFLRVRYKLPGEDESLLIERPITSADEVAEIDQLNTEARWAFAVAGFAQLLRNEPYLHDFGYDEVIALAQPARGEDEFGYRAEFIQLVRAAAAAADLPSLERPGQGGD